MQKNSFCQTAVNVPFLPCPLTCLERQENIIQEVSTTDSNIISTVLYVADLKSLSVQKLRRDQNKIEIPGQDPCEIGAGGRILFFIFFP